MKTILTVLLSTLVLSFSSCDLINELIPDIDTDFSKTFKIQIITNSGESDEEIIDVTTSEEYDDFKDNIEKFEYRKTTYLVKNANVPNDMYFNGNIVCSDEEGKERLTVGSIENANIAEIASIGDEIKVIDAANENIEKVLGWLDSLGKFKIQGVYNITNANGTPYFIDSKTSGSNFELEIKLYVTAKTKTKNS
jgi:hypothetical protein